MKISNEAKKIIEDVLQVTGFDCLRLQLNKTCCKSFIEYELGNIEENDKPISINGIPLVMDEEIRQKSEGIRIEVENEKLVILDEKTTNTCKGC